jgi:hypothetical protein
MSIGSKDRFHERGLQLVQPGYFPQKFPILAVNVNGSLAAGPVAGIWGSFELQSLNLAKEKCCTNMAQVVLLDTEANIPS